MVRSSPEEKKVDLTRDEGSSAICSLVLCLVCLTTLVIDSFAAVVGLAMMLFVVTLPAKLSLCLIYKPPDPKAKIRCIY